ncbi:MAG: SGNH/GDSL hydrolase family protein [Burkholderiales bacterium]|nr:SGNH/GDSL hydrolase family protein [Burkholderiales bacterium]
MTLPPAPPEDPVAPASFLHFLGRGLLSPMLMVQAARVKRDIPRLPEPPGDRLGVVGEGEVGLRILVVGDSSAAGVGAASQDEALGKQLAIELSKSGRGAVGWQVVARSGIGAQATLALMASVKLLPADVLVTVLGVNDVMERTNPGEWLRGLDAIHNHARWRAGVHHTVHCAPPRVDMMPVFPQPLRWVLGGAAARLDTALKARLRGARRRTRFALPFDPRVEKPADWLAADGFHPNALLYRRWAEALATHIDVDLAHMPEANAVRPSGFSGFDTLR